MKFMTFTNLIIILCCTIVLSYLLQIIVNYTNPNATIYVNMYSLYYIFLLTTLLFASACNSYIGSITTSEPITSTEQTSISGPEQKSATGPEHTSISGPETNVVSL
jgi:hypothetical protein